MRIRSLVTWIILCVFCLAGAPVFAQGKGKTAEPAAAKQAEPAAEKLDNAICLACHGNKGFATTGADGKPRPIHVTKEKFEQSVHGVRHCVDCHKDITDIPHKKGVEHKVSCVQCHQQLWEDAKKENKTKESAKLGVVVDKIEHYMRSIHARPNIEDQSRTNATCYNCHDAHYVYPKGSAIRAEWRLNIPNVCGKCHVKEREVYATSVHGREVLQKHNPKAAICSDCHTTHDVEDPAKDSTKLVITKNCGNCHAENLKTYLGTYHGQVNTLGYAYTAKCFDCHGNHAIQRVNDPKSRMHPDNRLATCQKCHKGATAGFVTFNPHSNNSNFDRYPAMWVASKFMIALLAGVFAFFWTHSALWFYREYQDRKEGKSRPHVAAEVLEQSRGKHFRRFGPIWRLAHLVFALSVMMLVLTGMAVFYAENHWAQSIVAVFGGPKGAGLVHRISAATMLGIFFVHLVYLAIRLGRNWRTFDWFGPNSLVPWLQDLEGAVGMFKWFFGKGPRPVFERWTYWEKFDYWAVFWGMAIIGGSGFLMWFPNLTAAVFPGWVFNVATLIHGEEAFLAAVFLFTVHFFNNHFRPDKYPPPDIVMFTGAVPVEEYRREHAAEYNRLVQTGELAKYLVDAPSQRMRLGSRILGLVLIAFGMVLLVLVFVGFFGSVNGVNGG
jgi:thiosulfate reductase cytochrome b subunit